ncbi:MAG: metallophosphoesterase [Gemmataceae bacterium]
MSQEIDRRYFLGSAAAAGSLAWGPSWSFGQQKGKNAANSSYSLPSALSAFNSLSVVLGRANDTSVTANLYAKDKTEAYLEYGTTPGVFDLSTKPILLSPGQAVETALTTLKPGTRYHYRLRHRKPSESAFSTRAESQFQTQRKPGSAFTFCVQGDSHPERPQMSEPNLYARTLQHAASCKPDLYLCMGDDFSVDKVRTVNTASLTAPYLLQRPFLSLIAQSASLYLVNGNHEQASLFNYQQKNELHELAVGVQTARNSLFPMPATEGIYSGDTQEFKGIGFLRDYYAWTWGDALFVVLDNYWHSPALVDTGFKGGNGGGKKADDKKNRDWWDLTIGNEQYHWLRKTLEGSKAKFKFVFAHHVLGSGRGGVEGSDFCEWGGKPKNKGVSGDFRKKRPGWELPIHQLMVKHGVSIFFQGHDHLYARQERDGVIYQEVPLPADPGYSTYNEDAYTTGTKRANSGYLRVAVSPEEAKVDYVRCWLPKDESEKQKTGSIAHSYTIKAKA